MDGLAELMKGMSTTIKAKAVAWCRGQDAKSVELVVAAGLEEQLAALGTELKVGGLQHRELTKRLARSVRLVMMRHPRVGTGGGPLRAIPIGTGHTVGRGRDTRGRVFTWGMDHVLDEV